TKRQQAAALQALRAYQRPVHPRKRRGTTTRARKLSVFRVNAEVWQRWVALRIGRCCARGR
ncbi:MAG TPA: hypothetical protein PLW35_06375, partial [Verrucomicrobiota bacterium]|nr:hypothetical protein [Verrucomicrobiota bacterium]